MGYVQVYEGGNDMILEYLGGELQKILKNVDKNFFEEIEEIRLRVNKPIIIHKNNQEHTVTKNGNVTSDISLGYRVTESDVMRTIENMSNFSLYAFENELKSGYITLPGGHRVGVSGKAILNRGEVKTINNISGMNIRVSHEIYGCSDSVLKYITEPSLAHTMIISPPACGKTTLLRDIVRQISDGVKGKFEGQTVGVIDERSEIAGCYKGIPQNNVGMRTDVLDGCPKAEGMIMLLRSMSPKVLAVDEIGKKEDIYAIDDIMNAGVKIICTVHGKSIEDLQQRDILAEVINKKVFERYVVLGYKAKIKAIYDNDLNLVQIYD